MPLFLLATALVAPLAAKETDVSLKIDIVAWGNEIRGLTLKHGREKGGVTALPFRYSAPVSYSGPALMEIHQKDDADVKETPKPSKDDLLHELTPLKPVVEPESGKSFSQPKQGIALELEKRRQKDPTLVALAQLPANCSRATILLAPAPDGTFVAYVIDDDPANLPPGQLRIHNLSPHDVAIRCGDQPPRVIHTRKAVIIPATNQQVIYELTYQLNGVWKFQENNVIRAREDEQTQMIVLRSANQFFRSSDGSSGGFLQVVTLRRPSKAALPIPHVP